MQGGYTKRILIKKLLAGPAWRAILWPETDAERVYHEEFQTASTGTIWGATLWPETDAGKVCKEEFQTAPAGPVWGAILWPDANCKHAKKSFKKFL